MKEKLESLISWLEESGFLFEQKSIPWGVSVRFLNEKVSINLYEGKKGFSWNIQGEKQSVSRMENEIALLFHKQDAILPGSDPEVFSVAYTFPWLGSDESGKGDIFGPLVFAGVCLLPAEERELACMGVKDSKEIKEKDIFRISFAIRQRLAGRFLVLSLNPCKYNELYSKFHSQGKNLNHLMGWGHARVLEDLLEKNPQARLAVVDQFADPSFVLSVFRKKVDFSLVFRPRAEENLAVAAASILAREKLLYWHEDVKKELGFCLPTGAGAVCKKFLFELDEKELVRYAKLHFQPVQDRLVRGIVAE